MCHYHVVEFEFSAKAETRWEDTIRFQRGRLETTLYGLFGFAQSALPAHVSRNYCM